MDNKVSDMVRGISIGYKCQNNIISRNIAQRNQMGIVIQQLSNFNVIKENDEGTNNDWNSVKVGNYWDNYLGPDNNHDYFLIITSSFFYEIYNYHITRMTERGANNELEYYISYTN